ncbi:MAG TPA: TIM44-like domain-containing protein [Casimicrobiaceae bacterium]|jgi:predicted lipid-binding transport protein (Tim44 family)
MKSFLALAIGAMTAVALLSADVADAKRLGGGRSFGMQRQNVAPSQPAPSVAPRPGAASDPVMPAQPAAAAARAATPAAPAPSGMSRWLGPIAGIAAGLGLAALMSHLGLSESFGSLLLVGLLVIGAIFLVRRFLLPRSTASPVAAGANRTPYIASTPPPPLASRVEPTLNSGTSSAVKFLPPGFDTEAFLQQAKLQFRRLQGAYDKADRTALSDVMTPALFAEVSREIDERDSHVPTEVAALDAEILEVVTEGRQHVASVRFNGLVREDGAAQPKPFVEIWNLVKPVDGSSGWLLAGIQQAEEPLALQ